MTKKSAMDAANRNWEAYNRGVETNRNLRDTRYMHERFNAQRVANAGGQEWFDARRGAADIDRWIDSYNIYMDESPAGEMDGEEGYEVEFLVVPSSTDDGDPENNAVLAGLDLVDLINLRDAIQLEIDNYTLSALEYALSALEA